MAALPVFRWHLAPDGVDTLPFDDWDSGCAFGWCMA